MGGRYREVRTIEDFGGITKVDTVLRYVREPLSFIPFEGGGQRLILAE